MTHFLPLRLKRKLLFNLRVSCSLTTNFHTLTFKTAFHLDSYQCPWIPFFHGFLESIFSRSSFSVSFHFPPSIFLQCSISFPSMLSSLEVLPIVRLKCLCVRHTYFSIHLVPPRLRNEISSCLNNAIQAINVCWGSLLYRRNGARRWR